MVMLTLAVCLLTLLLAITETSSTPSSLKTKHFWEFSILAVGIEELLDHLKWWPVTCLGETNTLKHTSSPTATTSCDDSTVTLVIGASTQTLVLNDTDETQLNTVRLTWKMPGLGNECMAVDWPVTTVTGDSSPNCQWKIRKDIFPVTRAVSCASVPFMIHSIGRTPLTARLYTSTLMDCWALLAELEIRVSTTV